MTGWLRRLLLRALIRLLPERWYSVDMKAQADFDSLDPEQRERLRENLRQLMRPKAA